MEATPADTQGTSCSHTVGPGGPSAGIVRALPQWAGRGNRWPNVCSQQPRSQERSCWVHPPDLPPPAEDLAEGGQLIAAFYLKKKETATQAHTTNGVCALKAL